MKYRVFMNKVTLVNVCRKNINVNINSRLISGVVNKKYKDK
jgi:hypothetical protein